MLYIKICSKCRIEKDETEFYKNSKMKDGLDYYCKSCRNLQTKKQYDSEYIQVKHKENLELISSLKEPCLKCGEDRMYLIQFHHVNPKDKRFSLSSCGTRSIESIVEESNKCVCLCSNCHDEFHYFYGKQPKNPVEALNKYLYE